MKEMLQARKEELQKRGVKGFTLMEMLIVVAIIAVLVAIAIPIFSAQLNKARVEADAANIRSGYALVSATVITDETVSKTAATTYMLNSDGTITAANATGGTFTTQGSTTASGASSQNIAGQTLSWGSGKAVTYSYSPTDLKVTISVAK